MLVDYVKSFWLGFLCRVVCNTYNARAVDVGGGGRVVAVRRWQEDGARGGEARGASDLSGWGWGNSVMHELRPHHNGERRPLKRSLGAGR